MRQEGERPAVRPAAGLELRRGDQQRGDEGAGHQEDAHHHRGRGEQSLGAADPPRGAGLGVGRIAVDVGHHRDARLEAGHAQGQLGEDDERDPDHRHGVAVLLGEGRAPVGHEVRVGGDLEQADRDHDDVESEVDPHQSDREPDRLGEAAQEHRAEQGQQEQRDRDLVAGEQGPEVGVLDQVRRGVGRRQGHGDDEVGGREAQQGKDEQLPLPEAEQPLEHRDRALTMGALLGDAVIDRQGSGEGERHEHQRRDRREEAGGQSGDAGLVAERREVVDAGQAHHPPPGLAGVGVLHLALGHEPVAGAPGERDCGHRGVGVAGTRRPWARCGSTPRSTRSRGGGWCVTSPCWVARQRRSRVLTRS